MIINMTGSTIRKRTFRVIMAVLIALVFVAYFVKEMSDNFAPVIVHWRNNSRIVRLHNYETNSSSDRNSSNALFSYTILNRGEYIRAGMLDVAISTAVRYDDFPAKNGFNVFLNGWGRHKSDMRFKCCLPKSINSLNMEMVEITASTYHVYSQWVVDMQNAEFSCSISQKQLKALNFSSKFLYVTFAQDSCQEAPGKVLRIEERTRIINSVGICIKASYGTLHSELIVEWMEYHKILGVTKVFTFLAKKLDPDARRVFLYYNSTGFLEANNIQLPPSMNGSNRDFGKPRWEQQAWVDEVMAINDCKHRMAGLDYVIIMDLDEWIVPKIPGDNIHAILQKTLEEYPDAGAFSLDSHCTILDWGKTRDSPMHVMSTTNRTSFANYDGADRNTRWAFIPDRVFFGQNNKVWPKHKYQIVSVKNDLFTLLHRRKCKPTWKNCLQLEIRVRDNTIVRYEDKILRNMKRLPLATILPGSNKYIHDVYSWNGSKTTKQPNIVSTDMPTPRTYFQSSTGSATTVAINEKKKKE